MKIIEEIKKIQLKEEVDQRRIDEKYQALSNSLKNNEVALYNLLKKNLNGYFPSAIWSLLKTYRV